MLRMPDQLGLFDSGDALGAEAPAARGGLARAGSALEQRYERFRVLAASLPAGLRMGTSSWRFPGWQGIVYSRRRSAVGAGERGAPGVRAAPAAADGRHRSQLLRADSRRRPARYADQLPRRVPVLRQGAGGGHVGEHLRDRGRHLPEPGLPVGASASSGTCSSRSRGRFARHMPGPFILQFSPTVEQQDGRRPGVRRAAGRVSRALPREFRYAVEIRDRWVLTDAYRDDAGRHGVGAHLQLLVGDADAGRAGAHRFRPKHSPS